MIHLVYPYGTRKAAPWSIGNHVASALLDAGHKVTQYDWEERRRIRAGVWDTLIGHPHPEPGFVFTDNLYQAFAQKITLSPWNGTLEYTDRIDQVIDACDHNFVICGPNWERSLPGWWKEKTTRLDMAIDTEDYPKIFRGFNPCGKRRVLYIGCTLPSKGSDYLAAIAEAMPDVDFSHVGHGLVPGTWPYGYVDLETKHGRNIILQHDAVISCGRNDANPTTMLEAAAWGLIPVCTKESGWEEARQPVDTGGIDTEFTSTPKGAFVQHIPLDNVSVAVEVLNSILQAPNEYLERIQQENLETIKNQYRWDKFTKPILECINEKSK